MDSWKPGLCAIEIFISFPLTTSRIVAGPWIEPQRSWVSRTGKLFKINHPDSKDRPPVSRMMIPFRSCSYSCGSHHESVRRFFFCTPPERPHTKIGPSHESHASRIQEQDRPWLGFQLLPQACLLHGSTSNVACQGMALEARLDTNPTLESFEAEDEA